MVENNWENKLCPALRGLHHANGMCRVIVELAGHDVINVSELIIKNHGTIQRQLTLIPALIVDLPYTAFQELALSADVRKIWRDAEVKKAQWLIGGSDSTNNAR